MSSPLTFWLDEVLANRAANTRRIYRIYLTQFLDFLSASAEAVIQQRTQDLTSADIRKKKRYENQLKKFDHALTERGLSAGSRKYAWAAVKSFFRAHDLDLKLSRADAPKGESEEMRAITKAEIRQVLVLADPRCAAMIYALKDTGLRASDLARLLVSDVDLEAEYPLLKVRTKKRGIITKTFLGPETQIALKKYLITRRYGSDTIPPETVTASSPLFRQNIAEVKGVSASVITVQISRLTTIAQLPGVSAHSFRRFYETALESAGVHANWIDRMIGHRLSGARGNYSKPTDTQLRDAYIAAYDQFRVDEPVFDNERLTKLEEERQREHGERQHLAERVLRVVDDNLAMKERLHAVEHENAEMRELLQEETAKREASRVMVSDMGVMMRRLQRRIMYLEEITGKDTS